MRVWLCVLQTSLSERLMYRGDFAFGTLMRFLPLVTQIFLWSAIFSGDPHRRINGYTYSEMVAYFLLTMVSRAFSSMPGLSNAISAEIRDGTGAVAARCGTTSIQFDPANERGREE